MKIWHLASEDLWMHQRWSLVFPAGSNRVCGQEKSANEVMQHREGVWYLCNVPEMWHQGTSLQIPDCQAFPFLSPLMSIVPWRTNPQVPNLAASTDEVLDVTLFPLPVQEDIFREHFQVPHDSKACSDGPTHSVVSPRGNSPPGLSAVPSHAISHLGVAYK